MSLRTCLLLAASPLLASATAVCREENMYATVRDGLFSDAATWNSDHSPFHSNACIHIKHQVEFDKFCANFECTSSKISGSVESLSVGKHGELVLGGVDHFLEAHTVVNIGRINGKGHLTATQGFTNIGQLGDHDQDRLAVVIHKDAHNEGTWCPTITALDTVVPKLVTGVIPGRKLSRYHNSRGDVWNTSLKTLLSSLVVDGAAGVVAQAEDLLVDSCHGLATVVFVSDFSLRGELQLGGSLWGPNGKTVRGTVSYYGGRVGAVSEAIGPVTYGAGAGATSLSLLCGALGLFSPLGGKVMMDLVAAPLFAAPLVVVDALIVRSDEPQDNAPDVPFRLEGSLCVLRNGQYLGPRVTLAHAGALECAVDFECPHCDGAGEVVTTTVAVTSTATMMLPASTITATITQDFTVTVTPTAPTSTSASVITITTSQPPASTLPPVTVTASDTTTVTSDTTITQVVDVTTTITVAVSAADTLPASTQTITETTRITVIPTVSELAEFNSYSTVTQTSLVPGTTYTIEYFFNPTASPTTGVFFCQPEETQLF